MVNAQSQLQADTDTQTSEFPEHPPPSYDSEESDSDNTPQDPETDTIPDRETAVEGLDGLLAIGPYSGDAVRTMASVKEFAVRCCALDELFERVKCDLGMLSETVGVEEARAKVQSSGAGGAEREEEELERKWIVEVGRRLVEEMAKMQKRYVDLLWETRALVTQVEMHLLDFVNTVLPCVVDYRASEHDRHAELRAFIDRDHPPFASPEGETPEEAFRKFEQELRVFLNETVDYATTYCQILNDRNKTWKAMSDSLGQQSKDCQDILIKTPAKVGLTLGVTAVGAVTALPVPVASVGIAAAGLGVAVAETVKIATNIRKIFDVSKKQKSLADLHELDKSLDRVGGIKSRLLEEPGRVRHFDQLSTVVSRLWDMAAEDAELVGGHDLEDIVHDEDLLLRIENITITYKAYTSALKEFVATVNRAGIFAGRASR